MKKGNWQEDIYKDKAAIFYLKKHLKEAFYFAYWFDYFECHVFVDVDDTGIVDENFILDYNRFFEDIDYEEVSSILRISDDWEFIVHLIYSK